MTRPSSNSSPSWRRCGGAVAALEGADAQPGRADEELTRSKAILQATIESLPFDFFAIGPDGRYMMQNAASKAHWGDATGKLPQEVCRNQDDLALWMDNNRHTLPARRLTRTWNSRSQASGAATITCWSPFAARPSRMGFSA